MTHVTCRRTAKNRDQLRNPTLANRVWATFIFTYLNSKISQYRVQTFAGKIYTNGLVLSETNYILTARRYASAVLAMGLCLSVRLSVTSRCSIETAGRIELVFGMWASFHPSYTVLKGNSVISKNKLNKLRT